MSEAIIELIVRCVFALAIVIYAILNKTSLSSVIKEVKELTNMYKIRNKDGTITTITTAEEIQAEAEVQKSAETELATPVALTMEEEDTEETETAAVEPKEEPKKRSAEEIIEILEEILSYIRGKS